MPIRGAYNSSKYSLRSYFPESTPLDANGYKQFYSTSWESLTDFERKYHITRKNINHCLEAPRRWLCLGCSGNGGWSVCFRSFQCQELFKDYCMYRRKNHPAKKGKGRLITSETEMDVFNRILYPQWF